MPSAQATGGRLEFVMWEETLKVASQLQRSRAIALGYVIDERDRLMQQQYKKDDNAVRRAERSVERAESAALTGVRAGLVMGHGAEAGGVVFATTEALQQLNRPGDRMAVGEACSRGAPPPAPALTHPHPRVTLLSTSPSDLAPRFGSRRGNACLAVLRHAADRTLPLPQPYSCPSP